ncbi:hypothetical protein B7C51_09160 [Paenibacillus larvae subsp. pulvifaciens]|uniref:Uncharacterized protein n=1 Tax=Paenibacillus larvae subsp. pulvifaciens TaxID=1477 RepID=A0A1V0URQ1_9BACL|nr:hypothetical protein [Paenibacillus larvae]ARF67959.1 hypothetical protein B7C51_09160 [Paenibacillus larvae subsp. pulvifaciens]MDT2236138.1 hypothetical protein [Paenibacillus larvae]MDT2246829.1 hypothetical protein [Paenibacillus larvae]MDT2262871.1 hypothetical protein [Paenibacillus larvae]MDT2274278.1 hypothetical protein [Paenibacillus larvae]
MDIWSIGPFQLKAELIISLISAAAGLAAIKIVHRKSGWHSAPVTDLVFNGLVIIFLFWKFGHVLSDPSLLWENSSLVVLASGTGKDIILGTLVAILYISAQAGKTSLDGATWLDFLAYGLTAGGACILFCIRSLPSFLHGHGKRIQRHFPSPFPCIWGYCLFCLDYASFCCLPVGGGRHSAFC